MNKNGAIIILNDLKKERDLIENKYNKIKNKIPTLPEKLLYLFGACVIFCIACIVYPTSIPKILLTIIGYGVSIPAIYNYVKFNKEHNLKKELDKKNKTIKKVELEINGIEIKHQYIKNTQQLIQSYKTSDKKQEEITEDIQKQENGPKLTLKRY